MFNKILSKFTVGIVVFLLVILMGCSTKENNSKEVETKENMTEPISSIENSSEQSVKSSAEILRDLANQEFPIEEDQSSDASETIVNFGKSFVNLYSGAVAEQEIVSFENYISNKNLLQFTNKMLELEQKRELKSGIGVIFGLENEFKDVEIKKLDENLYYLRLQFSNQGSVWGCKMLVQSENKSLKIVDVYFGNKDGVDTVVTGHPVVRKLDNPKLWTEQKWVNAVFEQLEKYETELLGIRD